MRAFAIANGAAGGDVGSDGAMLERSVAYTTMHLQHPRLHYPRASMVLRFGLGILLVLRGLHGGDPWMVLPEDLPHFPVARRNRPDLLQRGRLLDRIRQFQNRSDRTAVGYSVLTNPARIASTAVLVRSFPQGAESVSQSSPAAQARGCARTAVGLNTKRALPGPRIQRFSCAAVSILHASLSVHACLNSRFGVLSQG